MSEQSSNTYETVAPGNEGTDLYSLLIPVTQSQIVLYRRSKPFLSLSRDLYCTVELLQSKA
jgi:hypothetical protein